MNRKTLAGVPVLPALVTAAALGLGGAVGVAAFSGEPEQSRVPAVELRRSDQAEPTAPSSPSSPAPPSDAAVQEDPGSPTMGAGAREVPLDPVPLPAPGGDDDADDQAQDDDTGDDTGDDDGNGDDDGGDD